MMQPLLSIYFYIHVRASVSKARIGSWSGQGNYLNIWLISAGLGDNLVNKSPFLFSVAVIFILNVEVMFVNYYKTILMALLHEKPDEAWTLPECCPTVVSLNLKRTICE